MRLLLLGIEAVSVGVDIGDGFPPAMTEHLLPKQVADYGVPGLFCTSLNDRDWSYDPTRITKPEAIGDFGLLTRPA